MQDLALMLRRRLDEELAIYNREKGRYDYLVSEYEAIMADIESLKQKGIQYMEEMEVINKAGAKQLEIAVENMRNLSSYAIQKIYSGEYDGTKFTIEPGDKTRLIISLVKNFEDGKYDADPEQDDAGGVNDALSVVLKIAAVMGYEPFVDNAILADEPTKHVSHAYREPFAKFLKEIVDMTGRQMIVISHDPVLAVAADNVIEL